MRHNDLAGSLKCKYALKKIKEKNQNLGTPSGAAWPVHFVRGALFCVFWVGRIKIFGSGVMYFLVRAEYSLRVQINITFLTPGIFQN